MKLKIFAICFIFPTTCFAYIDPGSGILLWQMMIASVGALIFFVRHPIKFVISLGRKLLGFFKRSR
jgi:hypothetical protein